MNSDPEKTTERYYEIDLLRFFCALAVVLYHYAFRQIAVDETSSFDFSVIGELSKYGYFGFHLFFMISGFVILLSADGKSSSSFAISRMVRLYPAYWFSVTLTFIIILLFGAPKRTAEFSQYLVNLTMLQEFVGVKSIDGVYWTLAVELKFYFLIFAIIWFRQMGRIAGILGIWLLFTAITKFVDIKFVGFFLFPEWSYYFIAGSVFYLIRRDGVSYYKLALIGLSYIIALWDRLSRLEKIEQRYEADFSEVTIIALVSFCYAVFFMIVFRKMAFMNRQAFVFLGALTYPLYLIHQNIGYILFDYLLEFRINQFAVLAFVLAIMLSTAFAINRFVERRYSRKLHGFLTKRYNKMVAGASK